MAKNKKQDHNLSELKNGKKTVYRGLANDPERRGQARLAGAKRFL